MTITKTIAYVFILLLFPIIIGLDVQAQPQPNRNNTRQVGNMLQQLERSSSRFRNSLNVELVQRSVDQTRPQNDISTFQAGFLSSVQVLPPLWGPSSAPSPVVGKEQRSEELSAAQPGRVQSLFLAKTTSSFRAAQS